MSSGSKVTVDEAEGVRPKALATRQRRVWSPGEPIDGSTKAEKRSVWNREEYEEQEFNLLHLRESGINHDGEIVLAT